MIQQFSFIPFPNDIRLFHIILYCLALSFWHHRHHHHQKQIDMLCDEKQHFRLRFPPPAVADFLSKYQVGISNQAT